jgi:hypothetical protein
MLAAHQGLPARPFARPSGIVERAICAEGGGLPSQSCPATRQERFIAGHEPSQPDTSHLVVPIDLLLNCRAPAGYPADRVALRVFRILPAEAEPWMVAAGLPRVPREICPMLPTSDQRPATSDHNGVSSGVEPPVVGGPSSAISPAIIAPAPGAVFAISPGVPLARQQIEIKARAGVDVGHLTMYVDGQPLATFAGPPYRAFWPLAPGAHRASVSITDAQGKQSHGPEVEFVVEAAQ